MQIQHVIVHKLNKEAHHPAQESQLRTQELNKDKAQVQKLIEQLLT